MYDSCDGGSRLFMGFSYRSFVNDFDQYYWPLERVLRRSIDHILSGADEDAETR